MGPGTAEQRSTLKQGRLLCLMDDVFMRSKLGHKSSQSLLLGFSVTFLAPVCSDVDFTLGYVKYHAPKADNLMIRITKL
jgi:hypothetical protein